MPRQTGRVLTPEEVQAALSRSPSARDRAFCSVLWVTGARCSEALQLTKQDIKRSWIGYNDVMRKYVDKECLLIDMVISKRRRKDDETQYRRTVPVIAVEDDFFRRIIEEWASLFQKPESRLFPFSRPTAWQIVKDTLATNPHNLRHSRVTWLVKEKGFSDAQLMQYIGWKDSRPASIYTHLNYKDTAKKLLEGN